MIKTVEWTNEGIRMIDQRLLPVEEKYIMLRSADEVADAIRKMVIRGAPAIGVAAAAVVEFGLIAEADEEIEARTVDRSARH